VYLAQRTLASRFFGGFWSFPGGGCEPGDTDAAATCVRELREETGLDIDPARAELIPAGRWVTPAFSPVRYDAEFFLLQAPAGAAPDHRCSDGEHIAGEWVSPAHALDRWWRDQWLLPFTVVRVLRALIDGIDGAGRRCAEQAALECASPRVWDLLPGIACVPLRTPTLPPATHTNCYAIGSSEMVIIDPASPYPDEQAQLDHVLRHLGESGRRVREIWLTHHHPDHVGGVVHLARSWQVPVAAHARTAELVAGQIHVDRQLSDGDTLDLAGDPPRRLRCVFTPGHAPGHLCFVEVHSGLVVAGDMVASVGTIVIDPDEGDMALYLDSLERLKQLAPRALLPAHGLPIVDAAGKLDQYTEHRLWREQRVLAAVRVHGSATARELVPVAYDDVPATLFGLAERSLTAHLVKLAAEGRIRSDGERWTLC
jgi:endoribonuclease LACTB2